MPQVTPGQHHGNNPIKWNIVRMNKFIPHFIMNQMQENLSVGVEIQTNHH